MNHYRRSTITRFQGQHQTAVADAVVIEAPLAMVIHFATDGVEQTRNLAVTLRTPGHDEDLSAGFLLTEGIIGKSEDIEKIAVIPTGDDVALANIYLRTSAVVDVAKLQRNIYTNSSCGVCSKPTLESVEVRAPSLDLVAGPRPTVTMMHGLPQKLSEEQRGFEATGGIHAAALFDSAGECSKVFEDVGRHNAVDKLVGNALLANQLPLSTHGLLLSGRGGFELVQKAHVAGITLVAAVGAPTTLAISLAHRAGITLVGFLRNNRFNVYAHPHRIQS